MDIQSFARYICVLSTTLIVSCGTSEKAIKKEEQTASVSKIEALLINNKSSEVKIDSASKKGYIRKDFTKKKREYIRYDSNGNIISILRTEESADRSTSSIDCTLVKKDNSSVNYNEMLYRKLDSLSSSKKESKDVSRDTTVANNLKIPWYVYLLVIGIVGLLIYLKFK